MNKRYAMLMAAIVAGIADLSAAQYKFIPGSADYSSEGSYSADIWNNNPSSVLPGNGDVVYVMGTDSIVIDASNEALWQTINGFGRISCWTNTGSFVISVPEGTTAKLNVPLCYSTYNREHNRWRSGSLVKRGKGCLELCANKGWSYEANLIVEEGSLILPQNVEDKSMYYNLLAVSNGATLHMANWAESVTEKGKIYFTGLQGSGAVTADSSCFCYSHGSLSTVFSGDLSDKVGVYWASDHTMLTDYARNLPSLSSYDYETYTCTKGAALSVPRIGVENSPSPLGTNKVITLGMAQSGAGIRYIGNGEVASKTLSVNHSQNSPSFLDGGPNGNLVWEGAINVGSSVPNMVKFEFRGDNTSPCVFSGSMKIATIKGTNCTFYLTKKGNGTWRFTHNAQRDTRGVVAVENGTLQFDSLDEAGYVASLGYGTMLYSRDAKLLDPSKSVAYAICLGDPEGAYDPVFEYTGSGTSRASTRPVVLAGNAHIRNSASSSFRLHNISAIGGGERVLTLDGTGAGGNDIYNITDGDGKISVAKEGSGTWYVGGTNSFSGSLAVKEGTLYVRDPAKYTFYRWNVAKTVGEDAEGRVRSRAFGLFDVDGNRLNANMPLGGRRVILAPGEAGYEAGTWISNENEGDLPQDTSLMNLFDDQSSYWSAYRCSGNKNKSDERVKPNPGDRDTWFSIVMRLANGLPDVASYDFCTVGYKDGWRRSSVATWSMDASVDGVEWDEVVPLTTKTEMENEWNWWWISNGASCNKGDNTSVHKGMEVAGRKTSGIAPVLNNVSDVYVAPGATLATDAGACIEISKIRLNISDANAQTAGVIRNFTLAEAGDVFVDGIDAMVPRDFSLKLPDVSGCGNSNGISSWKVHLEGEKSGHYSASLHGGVLRICRCAMVITLR